MDMTQHPALMESVITFVLFGIGFIICIGLILVFTKQLNRMQVVIALLFGGCYPLLNQCLYTLYKPINHNPQVSTIAALIFIPIVLTWLCIKRNSRSLDRVFVTVIMWAIVGVWTIIHISMINYGLVARLHSELDWTERTIAQLVANRNSEQFMEYCRLHELDCQWENSDHETGQFRQLLSAEANNPMSMIHALPNIPFHQLIKTAPYILTKHYTNLSNTDHEVIFTVTRDEVEHRNVSVFLARPVHQVHDEIKVLFYLWMALVELCWIFGGLGLLWYHHKIQCAGTRARAIALGESVLNGEGKSDKPIE